MSTVWATGGFLSSLTNYNVQTRFLKINYNYIYFFFLSRWKSGSRTTDTRRKERNKRKACTIRTGVVWGQCPPREGWQFLFWFGTASLAAQSPPVALTSMWTETNPTACPWVCPTIPTQHWCNPPALGGPLHNAVSPADHVTVPFCLEDGADEARITSNEDPRHFAFLFSRDRSRKS